MPLHRSWIAIAALALGIASLGAQATNDESRLTVGIGLGYIGGASLWTVSDQPVYSNNSQIDEFAIVRRLRSNFTLTGQLTYFPKPTFGWTGELTYLGLGTSDGCHLVVDHGDFFNRAACTAIDGHERAASAIAAMGGAVWRPSSRGDLQPYLRGTVGLALVPRSTTAVTAFFGQDDNTALPLYVEDNSKAAKPIGALSIGFATAPHNGYQFRIEARATAVQLVQVTGPATIGNLSPPTGSKWVMLPSFVVAFDIVLEKRRGRRY